MLKEVLPAELGWFEECDSCDHRTRDNLIFYSPCSLVRFTPEGNGLKDENGEPVFVISPDVTTDENGKLDCPERKEEPHA